MRRFPRGRRARVGLRQFEPEALQYGLDFREVRGRRGLARARIGETGAQGLDRLAEHAIALRELHFLPPPQFLTQLPVTTGLCRLPLEGAALLLDFEDDVVDAREVLLRRFELQFRSTPAALVLGYAGGFLASLSLML